MNIFSFLIRAMLLLVLAACGGGGADSVSFPVQVSSPPPPPPPPPMTVDPLLDCNKAVAVSTSAVDALPGGIWFGTMINCVTSLRSDYAEAWVTEDGRFRVFGPDRLLLSGQLGTNGNVFVGDGREYSFSGPSDQRGTSLAISGSIDERVGLDGRWSTETGFSGVFALQFSASYLTVTPLFDELSGARSTWDLDTGVVGVWTIEPDGRFNGQDEIGCSASGRFTEIDSRYNLYGLEYTVVGCADAGSYSGLASVGNDGLSGDRLLWFSVDDGDQRATIIAIYF